MGTPDNQNQKAHYTCVQQWCENVILNSIVCALPLYCHSVSPVEDAVLAITAPVWESHFITACKRVSITVPVSVLEACWGCPGQWGCPGLDIKNLCSKETVWMCSYYEGNYFQVKCFLNRLRFRWYTKATSNLRNRAEWMQFSYEGGCTIISLILRYEVD